ncbi:MAG: hypothetical protein ACP5PC_07245 [bacterium]
MIWGIIILFLAFIAIFTLSFRYTTILAGRIAAKNVEKTHKIAEYIISTRMPPEDWLERWKRKIVAIKEGSGDPERIDKLKLQARDFSLKRLVSLIKYFENTNLVEDEGTRKVILQELIDVGRFWKENWEAIEKEIF